MVKHLNNFADSVKAENSVKVTSSDVVEYSHTLIEAPPINQVLQETHQVLSDINNILQS